MAFVYQLRIEHPEHPLKIYDLDESRGIAAIGQDPAGDIPLKSPGLAPCHFELDYRREPCYLTVHGQAEPVTVNSEAIPPGSAREIKDQDVIRVAGYTMIFRAYEDEPDTPVVVPAPPAPVAAPEPPEPEPVPPPRPAASPAIPDAPADSQGPAIKTALSEHLWIVEAGQPVSFQLAVDNSGPLVAHFRVSVEGTPPQWPVTISPAEFHLKEMDRAVVDITIIPPRDSASRAGPYPIKVVAGSPEYPDEPRESGEQIATLTVKPYYELAVGNLSPFSLPIPASRESGQVGVKLTNRGNDDAVVRLAGEDSSLAGRFEFQAPGALDEPVAITRQADVRVPFGQFVDIPVRIVPTRRPLIGRDGRWVDVRPRPHPYTLTVTLLQGQQGPWPLYGEWENSPRFGRWVLLAAALALLVVLGAFFRPRLWAALPNPASIRAGQVVELNWKAWPPFLVGVKLDGESVHRPVYRRPAETTTYELRADTWLSYLFPFLAQTERHTVEVRPVKPDILFFQAEPERATPRQSVVLSWVVDDAAQLILIDNEAGLEETLASPYGSREIKVGEKTVHYTLRAIGADGSVIERLIAVQVSSPAVGVFTVSPSAITSPTDVRLTWSVLGAPAPPSLSRAHFDPSAGRFIVDPPRALASVRGSLTLPVSRTTVFTLSAGGPDGPAVATARVKVVRPASASIVAQAPGLAAPGAGPPTTGLVIAYTALSPEELKFGGLIRDTREMDAARRQAVQDSLDKLDRGDLRLDEFSWFLDFTPSGGQPVTVLIHRESTQALIRRLLSERENPRADVIWMVAATGMIRLRAEGLLEPLAGGNEPAGLDHIKSGWLDPTPPSAWIGLTAWQAAFCLNPARLPQVDTETLLIPRSWEVLAGRDLVGLIAMPSPYTSGSGSMLLSGLLQREPFGEPDGWAYLDRLHENVAVYTASGDGPCDFSAHPEIAVGIVANRCYAEDEAGRPLTIYPAQGSGWEMDALALARRDEINRDAVAFVSWAIGPDAMREYSKFRPVLAYTEPIEPAGQCFTGLDYSEDEVIPGRYLWGAANYSRILEKWQSRYGSE